jgi:hypothetical protein
MNVGTGNEATQLHFWEHINQYGCVLSPQIEERPGPGGRPPLRPRLRLEVVVVLVEKPDQVVDLVANGVGGPEAGSSSKGCQLCKGIYYELYIHNGGFCDGCITIHKLDNSTNVSYNDLVSQLFYDKL